MVEDIFKNVSDAQLKLLYSQIISGREDGLRPRCFDEYINVARNSYQMSVGEAWNYTERLFFDEVARRYFENMK